MVGKMAKRQNDKDILLQFAANVWRLNRWSGGIKGAAGALCSDDGRVTDNLNSILLWDKYKDKDKYKYKDKDI